MVVTTLVRVRKMDGSRERSLPRLILLLDLSQPCRDLRLEITKFLFQRSLRLLQLRQLLLPHQQQRLNLLMKVLVPGYPQHLCLEMQI